MAIEFSSPATVDLDALNHQEAVAGNVAASQAAMSALSAALSGASDVDKILMRAAAGAGKSFTLVRMVQEALDHANCTRVAVTAFANKQVFPLAGDLGKVMGAQKVCLFVAADRLPEVPPEVLAHVSVAHSSSAIPKTCTVILGTSHKLGAINEAKRLIDNLGTAGNGKTPFDVLFVDEAWQLPLHRYATVQGLAPISVGVGDVGQLPPLDPGQNPWRGDPGYNPYRAWPTAYEHKATSCVIELPAVWRPTAAQLPLWRAFYNDWDALNCVAAPGDRAIVLPPLRGAAESVWTAVATGIPTLLEVEGLPAPDAADIDPPLIGLLEDLLAPLLEGGFGITAQKHADDGSPVGRSSVNSASPTGNPLIVLLATRNQAVDDAVEMADRLIERFGLPDGVLVASTVDSWQGRTNAITIALHPLSGSEQLDEFNSAFGRLAVTCTRATHGLLMVARAGLDGLLGDAPARPGTPFGEPGTRTLPRQTHQRILASFQRSTLLVDNL